MAKIKLSNRKRNIVGSLVSSLRKLIRISQNELAGRIQLLGWDVHKNAISQIEQGTRSVTDVELCLLAEALSVSAPSCYTMRWKKGLNWRNKSCCIRLQQENPTKDFSLVGLLLFSHL